MPDHDQPASAVPVDGAVAPGASLLSDRPLGDASEDRLGFDAYASALAGIIGDATTSTPLTIAISAAWGAGKTSLARMIEGKLLDPVVFPRRQNITCWFNAWMHDDAPNLGTAFAAKVARHINGYRPWWRRALSPLPAAFYSPQERWRRRIAMALGCVAVVALAALLPEIRTFLRELVAGSKVTTQLDRSLSAKWASGAVLVIAVVTAARRVFAAAQAAAQFVDDPQAEAAKGSMESVHDQLKDLINQAARRRRMFVRRDLADSRLVIFVDDLERCRPPRAVDVCEIANQLLSIEGVVTVLLGDMQSIATSAAMKYLPNVIGDGQKETPRSPVPMMSPFAYGRAYLEKIVQVQFNVPVSSETAMQEMLKSNEAGAAGKPQSTPPHSGEAAPASAAPGTGAAAASQRDTFGVSTAPGSDPESTTELIRRLKWMRRLENAMAVAFFVTLVGVWLTLLNFTSLRGWEAFLAGLGASIGFAMTGANLQERIEGTTGRKESELDVYIQQLSTQGRSAQELKTDVEQSKAGQNSPAAVVNQAVQSLVVEKSLERQGAEAVVFEFAPALPRGAKRMINQLRVALAVAQRRHMFEGVSPLLPEQLGKWVVLMERWPELGIRLTARPQDVAGLEGLTRSELSKKVTSWIDASDVSKLCDLLYDPPPLATVLEHLVRYEPVAPGAASSSSQQGGGDGQRPTPARRRRAASSAKSATAAKPVPESAGLADSDQQSGSAGSTELEQVTD